MWKNPDIKIEHANKVSEGVAAARNFDKNVIRSEVASLGMWARKNDLSWVLLIMMSDGHYWINYYMIKLYIHCRGEY